MTNTLQTKIALNLIPNVGPRLARRLVAYTGSVEAVFTEKKHVLEKVPGIGPMTLADMRTNEILAHAKKELEYIEKNNIQPCFYLDDNYPIRMRECEDAPVIMYTKGSVDFNVQKIISIVGTRKATEYGKAVTDEIVSHLATLYPGLVVVSGLAYGIDITAHKAALKNGLNTIAVLAHGFEFLYPAFHANVAREIRSQGALLTEFHSHRKPDPGNFISRNRIIAGLADATLVVESAPRGGALITADIAHSYNRDVLAVPGRSSDTHSRGCNDLIRQNKAALVENGTDVENALGWIPDDKKKPKQQMLSFDLNENEQQIIAYLEKQNDSSLDIISRSLKIPVSVLSASLLELEFKGLVQTLPGKTYRKL